MGVVLLAGGTGGAKLACGLQAALGTQLSVIANPGDDAEVHGGYVSPDPDLITFWLAERIDERGWGLLGDTFEVMDGLRELGDDVWFNLGDRDLALCLHRAERLRRGERLTDIADSIRAHHGVAARVLPVTDDRVRTHVRARDAWHGFQAFMIRERAAGPIDDVHFNGAARSAPTDAVLRAIADADAIIIGPSNPIISIGPILAVPGVRAAITQARAPVIAVSPLVRGTVVKGPTAACMAWAGQPATVAGVAALYSGLIDAMVADEPVDGLPTLVRDVGLDTPAARRAVADATLEHAAAVAAARD